MDSSGLAVVVLDEPAESFLAEHFVGSISRRVDQFQQGPDALGLMRSLRVVVVDEGRDQVVEMLVAKDDEVLEADLPPSTRSSFGFHNLRLGLEERQVNDGKRQAIHGGTDHSQAA